MEKQTDLGFAEYLIKAIVSHPEDVKIDRTVDEMGVLLTVNVNKEDIGYVIGKKGQTAKSVRTLLKIIGAKNNERVNMKIYEPDRPDRPAREGSEPTEE